jgi:choline monooxygenase
MSAHLRRLLDAFDPSLPLAQARTIPAEWYADPELAALERRAVFGQSWQLVGRTAQLDAPGRFLTADVAGSPVLVARSEAGGWHALANVCRHRAARVCVEPCGTATKFRCRYHGWTYDLAGRLKGTPEWAGVEDFTTEDNALPERSVAAWGPLVFVHLGPLPAHPPSEFLGPLTERLAWADLDGLTWVASRRYELRCNWKVFVDNYLDGGYHVNTLHPGLAGVLDYSHYRTDLFDRCSVQHAPLRPAEGTVGAVRGGQRAEYWWVFPNLMLNVYDGLMDTNRVLPLGPDRCAVEFDFWFRDAEGEAARRFIDESIAVADAVQAEDAEVCEDVQRGLESGDWRWGRFGVKREAGGYHFHRLLAAFLRAGLEGGA